MRAVARQHVAAKAAAKGAAAKEQAKAKPQVKAQKSLRQDKPSFGKGKDLGKRSSNGDGRVERAQRLRHERRNQILEGACSLFAQRGYHETSIQDILDAASIARGTFYLYFDGKRAIFDQLIDDFLERIQAVVTPVEISPTAPPPLEQVRGNLARVMAVLQSSRGLTRIILRLAEGLDAQCDAKMADFYDRLLRLLNEAIHRGQHLGLVRFCDPQVAAHAVLGSLKEVVLQWIVLRDSDNAERDRITHELLAFSLRGLFVAAP